MKLPIPEFLVKGLFPLQEIEVPKLQNHIVFIGKDSRSLNLSRMACQLKLPYVSIVFDPASARARQAKGEMVIYGDALNEPILQKAYVETAEIVVVSIGDAITALGVIEQVRRLNKTAYIMVRSRHVSDIEDLYAMGADQVIPEEFETAIEMFERILKKLLIPKGKIEEAIEHIRDDNYGIFREKEEANSFALSDEIPGIEIVAVRARNYPVFQGKSLKDIHLRTEFGVTVVAVKREDDIHENPAAGFVFEADDILYILGKPEKIARLKQSRG
jgi:CPA2 family monovalent cation:H+ antiporter-2